MNTKLKDHVLKAARVLALLLACALFVTHSPAAKAAAGDELWYSNYLYVSDGTQWVYTGWYRSFPDPNNGNVWNQANSYEPSRPAIQVNTTQLGQGWLLATVPGFFVAVPWRNSYQPENFFEVDSAYLNVLINGSWTSLAQLNAAPQYIQVGPASFDPLDAQDKISAGCALLQVRVPGATCVQR